MTKYEELDIAGLTAMELAALIQPGDMLTISGPGICDTAVRVVNESGRIYSFMATAVIDVDRLAKMVFVKITKIERPIPEVELPTEPGYYVSKNQVYIDTPLTLFRNGEWVDGYGRTMSEERLHYLMPLTRLVPETETASAKLADRLDVEKLVALLRRNALSITGYYGDAEDLIAAIDNGELDK